MSDGSAADGCLVPWLLVSKGLLAAGVELCSGAVSSPKGCLELPTRYPLKKKKKKVFSWFLWQELPGR